MNTSAGTTRPEPKGLSAFPVPAVTPGPLRERLTMLPECMAPRRSSIVLRVRDATRHDDCLTRFGHALLTAQSGTGPARQGGEALLLVRMDVLGDHPARTVRQVNAYARPP